MLNFCLSQPNSISRLVKNFYNFVFPYYIFPVDKSKTNIESKYLILDFVNFTVEFYLKQKIAKSFLICSFKV